MKKKFLIVGCGGDCGGIEGAIRGATTAAEKLQCELYVSNDGFLGLIDDFNVTKLDEVTVDDIGHMCGNKFGNTRVNPYDIDGKDRSKEMVDNLKKRKFSGMTVIGGDDHGGAALRLYNDYGFPIIFIPKTMDGDIPPYTIGFNTAAQREYERAIHLRTSARGMGRGYVMTVMGRNAGILAYEVGVSAYADVILLSGEESPFDIYIASEAIDKKWKLRSRKMKRKRGWFMVIVSESAQPIQRDWQKFAPDKPIPKDVYKHERLKLKHIEDKVASSIEEITGYETRPEGSSYEARSGESSYFDSSMGRKRGVAAMILFSKGLSGLAALDIQGGYVECMPIKEAIEPKRVNLNDVAFAEKFFGINFGRNPQPYNPKIKSNYPISNLIPIEEIPVKNFIYE